MHCWGSPNQTSEARGDTKTTTGKTAIPLASRLTRLAISKSSIYCLTAISSKYMVSRHAHVLEITATSLKSPENQANHKEQKQSKMHRMNSMPYMHI